MIDVILGCFDIAKKRQKPINNIIIESRIGFSVISSLENHGKFRRRLLGMAKLAKIIFFMDINEKAKLPSSFSSFTNYNSYFEKFRSALFLHEHVKKPTVIAKGREKT